MPDLSPGSVFAGHRIEGIAGRGGMGVVYRATHLVLDHVVALKVISPNLAGDPRFRRRFADESRIAVSLRHPNVVAIHHAGEEDGLLFVTMDLIDGTDLRGLLNRRGTLEPAHAVAVTAQIAAALDVAHAKGLVHRDIKPGNVLIEGAGEDERVYLTDFGLARQIEASTGVTATGAFVGTLDYVAPEQIRGERVDARADVYALGCVLFELLTGNPPFAAREDKVAKMYAHLQEDPPRLRVLEPGLPGGLDLVLARAIEKDPAARFPSAGDLARAAEAALAGGATMESERSVATGAAAPGPPEATTTAERARAQTTATAATAPGVEAASPQRERPSDEAITIDRSPRERPGGRRRAMWLASIAGLAAVAVVLALALGGGDDAPKGPATSITDAGGGDGDGEAPASARLLETVAVAGFPVGVAHGEGGVWVTSREGGQVSLISADPKADDSSAATLLSADHPEDVAIGDGSIWVAAAGSGEVLRLDRGGEERARIAVGGVPAGAAFAEGSAWVADSAGSRVFRIDGADNSVEEIGVGESPYGITSGGGSIWVVNRGSGTLTRLEPRTNAEVASVRVGSNPKEAAFAAGRVFVTNTDSSTVSVVDSLTDEVTDTLRVGDDPRGVIAFAGHVWVVNGGSDSLSRIDPETLEVIETFKGLPKGPEAITAGPDTLWVTSGEGQRVARIDPGA